MRAGLLRGNIVEIEERVDAQDALGEPIATWQVVRTVRARVEPVDGAEFFRSDATLSDHPIKVTMRYDSSWTPAVEDRLVWRDESYDIKSVSDLGGRRRTREIMAVRRA